jgi:hypothetical protein
MSPSARETGIGKSSGRKPKCSVSYLGIFGATEDDITVEHEILGVDKPFHYWITTKW